MLLLRDDDALDWRWVIPTLSRTHRVYAPDMPRAERPDRFAAALEQFLG